MRKKLILAMLSVMVVFPNMVYAGELPTDDYVGCGFCEAVKRLDGRSLAHDPL